MFGGLGGCRRNALGGLNTNRRTAWQKELVAAIFGCRSSGPSSFPVNAKTCSILTPAAKPFRKTSLLLIFFNYFFYVKLIARFVLSSY